MTIKIKFNEDPENKNATAMILDLRNSTALHRALSKKTQRMLIVEMMCGIHEEILNYLYVYSGINETDFGFNDTGDGYLIVFTDKSHAFSCVICATHLRDFLKAHIDKFNKELKLDRTALRYSFGIGIHTAHARFIEMKYKTADRQLVSKKLILGTAANSAARIESMTKNFLNVDLLITGSTRQRSYTQAPQRYKRLLKKDGPYISHIGEVRHMVNDFSPRGHKLYTISNQFFGDYKYIK